MWYPLLSFHRSDQPQWFFFAVFFLNMDLLSRARGDAGGREVARGLQCRTESRKHELQCSQVATTVSDFRFLLHEWETVLISSDVALLF